MSSRKELIENALYAGRENSMAGVLLHSVIAAQVGLGATDQKTFDILLRLGPLTAGEIAKHTGLTSASVTSLIDRLESKGFVQRERDTRDRRKVVVHARRERLTDFGIYFESFLTGLYELLDKYNDEEISAITDFLTRSAELSRREALSLAEASEN